MDKEFGKLITENILMSFEECYAQFFFIFVDLNNFKNIIHNLKLSLKINTILRTRCFFFKDGRIIVINCFGGVKHQFVLQEVGELLTTFHEK
jgi:hypothetical protein